jgi:Golgi nucleoside diphosphatase
MLQASPIFILSHKSLFQSFEKLHQSKLIWQMEERVVRSFLYTLLNGNLKKAFRNISFLFTKCNYPTIFVLFA